MITFLDDKQIVLYPHCLVILWATNIRTVRYSL
jgi:hypothetical protein